MADYSASKFGAVGFAESLSAEINALGKDRVKSTLVCPYIISTGMFDGEIESNQIYSIHISGMFDELGCLMV